MMWHKADVDSVHDERIGKNEEQLLKNVIYINFAKAHLDVP